MRKSCLVGVSLIAVLSSGAAMAQGVAPGTAPAVDAPNSTPGTPPTSAVGPATTASPDARASETGEIIVTATKRAQTLESVPISVSVTSEATIEKAQIRDLVDLQSVVPSLKVSQLVGVGQTTFSIRGFGGNQNGNDGIENSVGVFIDGVYRSRSYASIDDLPDVQRIEVLRGPQSTLFGKNVSAGAISIVTRLPQFDFGAKAEVSVGNYGLIQSRATVTGPITDKLAVTLFGSLDERQGYIHNTTTGIRDNDRNRQSLRADVLFKPTDNLSIRVIGDFSQIREKCCGTVALQNGPASQFIAAPPPFGLGKTTDLPQNRFANTTSLNIDPTNRLRGGGVSGQIDYNAGFATLTSITAYREQVNDTSQDADFTSADIVTNTQRARYKTFTQEFRITSKGTGPFTWLLGGFYENEKLYSASTIGFGRDARTFIDGLSGRVPAVLLGALPANLAAALRGQSNIYAVELLQSLVTPSIVPGKTYFQAGPAVIAPNILQQDSYSIFGQADYKVTKRLTITGGVAYLNDRKRATTDYVLTDGFSALNLQAVPQFSAIGLPGGLYAALTPLQFFYNNTPNHGPINLPNANENGILKGNKVTYAARAAYDLGRANVYFSYSTGWKAGAYNLSTDSRPPNVNGVGRTAGPENVTVYEVGAKARFHGGFLNLAVFDQKIEGFQSNLYTGTGYALVNAGQERVRGVEIDTAYAPTRWLALTGAVTYLDPKYDSFKFAPCVSFDTVRCPVNAIGVTPTFRDLSGTKPANIAEWSASVSATISHDFGRGIGSYLRGEYDYGSSTALADNIPANISTYGVNNINASLGFTFEQPKLEVLLFARNLANDRSIIAAFPTVAQAGSYSGFPNLPRTFGATFRKRF